MQSVLSDTMNVQVKFWLHVGVLPRPPPHLAGLQGQAMVAAELQPPLCRVLPGCHPGMKKSCNNNEKVMFFVLSQTGSQN